MYSNRFAQYEERQARVMDYKALNENQRKRMLQISKNDFSMEWENPD